MHSSITEFTKEYFDSSSKAWIENKVRIGQMYFYKCKYIHSNGKQCSKSSMINDYCKQHYILCNKNMRQKKEFK